VTGQAPAEGEELPVFGDRANLAAEINRLGTLAIDAADRAVDHEAAGRVEQAARWARMAELANDRAEALATAHRERGIRI
jgi:hypothetical protein